MESIDKQHPKTIEDVLRDFADDVWRENLELGWVNDGIYAEYADKLREVLRDE